MCRRAGHKPFMRSDLSSLFSFTRCVGSIDPELLLATFFPFTMCGAPAWQVMQTSPLTPAGSIPASHRCEANACAVVKYRIQSSQTLGTLYLVGAMVFESCEVRWLSDSDFEFQHIENGHACYTSRKHAQTLGNSLLILLAMHCAVVSWL